MKKSSLRDFFNKTKLERPFIIGYYGGENFGDELLLEIIQNALSGKINPKKVSFYYSNPAVFLKYHKDFGFKLVNVSKKSNLLLQILKSKEIILGGGGFWGVDFNRNVFLMSIIFFIARYFLFKKVYLIGVGYYSSTTKLGHLGALFSGVAANLIIARDNETHKNFIKILFKVSRKKVKQDSDLAFYISEYVQENRYINEIKKIEKVLKMSSAGTALVAIRDFKYKTQEKAFLKSLEEWERDNSTINKYVITFGFLTDKTLIDRESLFDKICDIVNVSPGKYFTYEYNPISLYLFFKKYNKSLKIFAPQFHVIMIAHLAGVKFAPISYDNKVTELLKMIGIQEKDIIKLY